MRRSPVTAVLRVYDSGQEQVAVYYVDLLGEQRFVDVWERSRVAARAEEFIRDEGFDKCSLATVRVGSRAAS